MIIICIYDESDPVYTTGTTYSSDKTEWEIFIDGIDRSRIRVGLMVPQGTLPGVIPSGQNIPKDTDRLQWDTLILGSQAPRVQQQDIVNFFDFIKTNPGNMGGSKGPDLLLFCLDNSGSITVPLYAAELAAAKEELKAIYPRMTILDDISNFGERYIRDSFIGAKDRTCG